MIKARLIVDDQPLIVLGLSEANMTRLMADEPIMFSLREVGLGPGRMVIVGGSTEEAITEHLEGVGLFPKGTGDSIKKAQS